MQPTLDHYDISSRQMLEVASQQVVHWLCYDDVSGAFLLWSTPACIGPLRWYMHNILSSSSTTSLFKHLHLNRPYSIMPLQNDTTITTSYGGLDAMFIPYQSGSIIA